MDLKLVISKWPLHWALGGNDFTGGLEQNAIELEGFCNFILDNNIKSYTEVGIAAGLLLKFMINELGLDADGITLEKRDTHVGLPITYGDSTNIEIIKNARQSDLYFIDANHSYEYVKADYNNYKDKCIYMAFHDMLGQRDCGGVAQLWSEIKNQYPCWEFVDPNLNQASGIGVIKLK